MTTPTFGKLYLIPCFLGEHSETMEVLPQKVTEVIRAIDEYIVENEKSARHFLKKAGINRPLQEVILHPLNQHTPSQEINGYLQSLFQGKSMGIISEAGCPGVADPGAEVVRLAHEKGISVIPLVGPSSILLGLMASGFNGQHFAFNGYLPKERPDRIKKLKELEKLVQQRQQTQLFIETPYRNNHLLEDMISICDARTKLCIACDITQPSEFIHTKTMAEWKKQLPDLNKRPTLFILGS